jgi:hypothetical protein
VKRFTVPALALVLFAISATAFAQNAALATTTTKPVVDGVVNPNEYSFSKDYKDLVLYVNRTADSLTIAVVGVTDGWVALGLGSQKMDGATIFIGFVDASGKVQFKPQTGRGHSHRDPTADVNSTIVKYAMKDVGGKTTLEVELNPASYIKAGQTALDMIYAVGTDKSFVPGHMFRGSIGITLK